MVHKIRIIMIQLAEIKKMEEYKKLEGTFQYFFQVFEYCASQETSFGLYAPRLYGELHNHCGCVAYSVQQLCGGKIIKGTVLRDNRPITHYWNQLHEMHIDFCAEQFGLEGIQLAIGTTLPTHTFKGFKSTKTVNPRFQLFWSRVQQTLNQ